MCVFNTTNIRSLKLFTFCNVVNNYYSAIIVYVVYKWSRVVFLVILLVLGRPIFSCYNNSAQFRILVNIVLWGRALPGNQLPCSDNYVLHSSRETRVNIKFCPYLWVSGNFMNWILILCSACENSKIKHTIFSTVSCHLWHLDSKSDRSKCIDIVLSIEVVSHKWKKKKIISHEKLITDTKYCNWFILYEDGGTTRKAQMSLFWVNLLPSHHCIYS